MILGLIGLVVVTEAFADAFGYVLEPDNPTRIVAVVAGPLSLVLELFGTEVAAWGFAIFAWAHVLAVMAFGTYLPYSKHLHIITSEPNVYLMNLEPRGALRKMDLEADPPPGGGATFGAAALRDLTWRHLLDPLACTECGRCMEFCPASYSGKTLSPKHLMEGLRDQIVAAETALVAAAGAQRAAKGASNGSNGGSTDGPAAAEAGLSLAKQRALEALSLPLVDNAIPEEAVWQCTTCGWCVEGCPVLIEHVDTIVEIRRNLVLEESRFPRELAGAFRNMETAGNPWGQPRAARLDWAKGLDVPVLGQATADVSDRWRAPADPASAPDGVLYWVGCAGAFDERNRKVVRAHGRPAPPGRRSVLGPGQRRNVQRRPGPAGGQRVPVPDPGRGERGHPHRRPRPARDPNGRRLLPALLQHIRTSTRSSAWAGSRSSTTPSCWRRWWRTAG